MIKFYPCLILGEQFSLITEPPHLERTRANIELVDGAINMKILNQFREIAQVFRLPVEKYRVNPRCHGVVSRSVNLHAYV